MKTTRPKPVTTPAVDVLDALLSPQWGFLVQFRAVPGGPVYAAGRVEHLASGRTTHFQSLAELTRHLEQALEANGSG